MERCDESEARVLVITRAKDATADHAFRRMRERNIPYLRLNAEDFGKETITLRFPNIHDSIITVGNVRISINNIRGVWLRRLGKPEAKHIQDSEARSFAESELDFTLRWLIDLLGNYCSVLDDETKILEGRNKFDQLALAEIFGFQIPATLVTNDPMAAAGFVKNYKAAAIKSVAGYGRQVQGGFYTVYTKLVTEDVLAQFDSIRLAPVCLQEYVEKEFELRITVVGEKVFGCRIDSQTTQKTQVDWRRYDNTTPYSIFEVDEKLKGQLVAMMKHYGIRFASFDMISTPEGRIVFLEMNPASQYLWIEKRIGLPITDAIIDEILVQCRG
jgi:glutathione synthase/RimK-type ligase-like ATP-grasp enzyme